MHPVTAHKTRAKSYAVDPVCVGPASAIEAYMSIGASKLSSLVSCYAACASGNNWRLAVWPLLPAFECKQPIRRSLIEAIQQATTARTPQHKH